ncbi:MAG: glycoside hydrolase family 3 N-terminal domain-containing protein [Oribacterium sp.]|nr:glycoside hydrolase family 3 C-terminal domain-containing protein [Oribacterium sp.]MDD6519812.1 glycoside hydrolase family 3 N-terminal domain-containing protein [Oribacterium sp.]MDY2854733.1 glycoside hydrolase family 3 N-terminal domain-containing protein [Oliverpabstia sp.]
MKINEFTRTGTTSEEISEREQRHRILAREAAEESIVLLKNDGVLPLPTGIPVALFGAGAGLTIKGGTGSGDVNVRHSVSIYDGFTLARVRVTSKDWIEDYEERYELARQAWKRQILDECGGTTDGQLFFDTYTSHAFEMPEGRPIEDTDVQDAKTAVYVISRVAGEGSDRHLAKGDYYLTDHELEDIRVLATLVEKIVIVINAGAPIDLTVLEAMPEVKAILFMGQAGEEGGNACARILLGFVNPSAKLTATWAKRYMDYPGAMEFSDVRAQLDEDNAYGAAETIDRDALLARSRYEEGIYVGYRYFDSFGVTPRYHFGHGLSYTSFVLTAEAPRAAADGLYIPVTVENTGNPYAGKEVVQVYAACPQPAVISGEDGVKAAASGEPAETLTEDAGDGGAGVKASAQAKVEAKEYKRLVAFRKTRLLAPGEQETMTLHVDGRALASFRTDYDAAHGAWVIEAGRYAIFVGSSSEESRLQLAGVVEVAEEKVLEIVPHICPVKDADFHECAAPVESLRRKTQAWSDTWATMKQAAQQGKRIAGLCGKLGWTQALGETVWAPGEEPVFRNAQDDLDRMAHAIASALEVKDLIPLLMGEFDMHASALGSAGQRVPGTAGETSRSLEELLHVPGISMADGPAGLRLSRSYLVERATGEKLSTGIEANFENGFFASEPAEPEKYERWYQFTTAWPVGTNLAQTWNEELLGAVGRATGIEMEEFHVAWWLAPGMNIQRNPLNGRNFEYYSEDPLLSGKMAAAITKGVQTLPGVGTTVKHFACNNQENNRMGVDAVVSERALREIYLRGFEIAIKESQPMCIMTSYNEINGVHSANNADLCTEIARREWHFQGVIMTDWATTLDFGGADAAGCVAAGNDLIMPGATSDLENIEQAYAEGRLSEADIRSCAERVLNIVLRTNGYADATSYYARFA